jgi:uncharacterized protein (DUF2252 family)
MQREMPALRSRKRRYHEGVQLRERTPLELHADLRLPAARDAIGLLACTDRVRVPELVSIRYERMLASPFAYLRGAAAVMADDLKHQASAGIPVQACGDCHLMNFGAFTTPEENILFDINDFDETLPGVDFTIDLKRLIASVAVAAINGGASNKRARAMAASAAGAYRVHIRRLAKLSPLEIWHSRIELAREIERIDDAGLRRKLRRILARADKQVSEGDNFPHLTKGKRPRIVDRPPLIYHLGKRDDRRHHLDAERVIASYRERLPPERLYLFERYELRDIAFKVVGVGSVGTFCAVGLFMSADGAPLLLQIKEARQSVLECLGIKFQGHPGRRVVEGQRTMQAASDIFLGWAEDGAPVRHFYVRHLKNRRLGSVSELVEEQALASYARLCGRSLARAHARSADPAMLAGYMGESDTLDDALASFALAYADRTQTDYDDLSKYRRGIGKKT